MKFREPVPIRTGPHSPREKEKNSSQQQQQEAAAEAAPRAHTDIDMSHSTPEQPTFGEHDESDSLPSDAIAAAELDDLRDRRVYAARLGCVLHILHIAVTAGMTSTFFMGPLGKGPWNEWERDHVFSLLGLVWYNTIRSDSPGKGCRGAKGTSRFFWGSRFVLGSRFFFGGRRSGVHGDARNDDQEAIFDTPVLDGGVGYASSVFCAVCFETQGSV